MQIMIRRDGMRVLSALAVALLLTGPARAQQTQQSPPTDSSVEASPLRPGPNAPATDSSAEASPVPAGHRAGQGVHVAPHTAIPVKLDRAIDSGRLKNGDSVDATLSSAVRLQPRGELAAGTPVTLTVVETLPAGRIYAAGEFSLQVERVGKLTVYTNTLTYRGKPGHKDLPDSAPQVGTDAGLPAGAAITFHVLPPPSAATAPPNGKKGGPGGLSGVAAGGSPPPGSTKQANGGAQPGGGTQTNNPPANGAPLKNAPETKGSADQARQPSSPSPSSPVQSDGSTQSARPPL
jgi:hypothetical protein